MTLSDTTAPRPYVAPRLTASVVTAGVILTLAAPQVLADFRLERTLPLANDGRFELAADGGAVEIVGDRSEDVTVVITADNDDLEDYLSFAFESSPGLARVEAERTEKRSSWRGMRNLKFTIHVPNRALIDARTAGGSVDVEQIGADATVKTAGGSIDVTGVDGDLNAITAGGSIAVEEVTGAVRVRTSGGSITLEDLASTVDAVTSGGSITAAFNPGNESGGSLKTSAGAIRVALDPRANLSIDARTSVGGVRSTLPIQAEGKKKNSRLQGQLGAGGEQLTLRTSAGGISLAPLDNADRVESGTVMSF
ncbi:MAG: DUF4097 family beta strand repeat-containing protein [Pseudomonadota bacterium]